MKNTYYYASRLIQSGGAIVFYLIIAGKIDPEVLGKYELVVTSCGVLIPLISFQVNEVLMNRYLASKSNLENLIFQKLLFVILLLLFIFLLLSLFYKIAVYIAVFLALFSVPILSSYLYAKQFYLMQLCFSLIESCTLLLPMFFFHEIELHEILMFVSLSKFIPLWFVFDRTVVFSKAPYLEELVRVASAGFKLVFNSVSGWVIKYVDRIFIAYFLSYSEVGQYALAAKLAGAVYVLMFAQYSRLKIRFLAGDEYRSFLRRARILNVLVSVLILLLATTLRNIYDYLNVNLLFLLVLGFNFQFESLISGLKFLESEKFSLLSRSSMLAAILNLVCNIILIPFIGIKGAALSTALSYMVLLFIRKYKTNFSYLG